MSPRPKQLHVTLVVAAARNGVIGRDGDMPWRMPSSLKQFRRLTMGRPMIMGRKTAEAIGRALDGRDTIVVTRNPAFKMNGAHIVGSLKEAFAVAILCAETRGADEIVVVGGGEIYRAAMPYATGVHLDVVEAVIAGDTTFPDLDPAEWREASRSRLAASSGDEHPATAVTYERIAPAKTITAA
ncbi:MAG: dihydrofolate reductase [Hyphomicrobiaceae bacterium]|nr:dihydrofolate reductase [Hyphomicrobiaceae bacterium]